MKENTIEFDENLELERKTNIEHEKLIKEVVETFKEGCTVGKVERIIYEEETQEQRKGRDFRIIFASPKIEFMTLAAKSDRKGVTTGNFFFEYRRRTIYHNGAEWDRPSWIIDDEADFLSYLFIDGEVGVFPKVYEIVVFNYRKLRKWFKKIKGKYKRQLVTRTYSNCKVIKYGKLVAKDDPDIQQFILGRLWIKNGRLRKEFPFKRKYI